VKEPSRRYVSRGGTKLEGALESLKVDVVGLDAIDVGSSTGGFTDCLLQRGASRVVAVDVGRGQLHLKLRQDPRVTVLERFNIRRITGRDLPFVPSLATVDVSFISLDKVIGPVFGVMAPGAKMIALVKPQFEAGPGKAPKGVVRDSAVHLEVLVGVKGWLQENGLALRDVAPSRIKGPKGNIEYFIRVERDGTSIDEEVLAGATREAWSVAGVPDGRDDGA
jgi:23S rRNA (cytidine1920-2'-O)/16S rRNA (cytidine1409-2'-O)-methyltransferase